MLLVFVYLKAKIKPNDDLKHWLAHTAVLYIDPLFHQSLKANTFEFSGSSLNQVIFLYVALKLTFNYICSTKSLLITFQDFTGSRWIHSEMGSRIPSSEMISLSPLTMSGIPSVSCTAFLKKSQLTRLGVLYSVVFDSEKSFMVGELYWCSFLYSFPILLSPESKTGFIHLAC